MCAGIGICIFTLLCTCICICISSCVSVSAPLIKLLLKVYFRPRIGRNKSNNKNKERILLLLFALYLWQRSSRSYRYRHTGNVCVCVCILRCAFKKSNYVRTRNTPATLRARKCLYSHTQRYRCLYTDTDIYLYMLCYVLGISLSLSARIHTRSTVFMKKFEMCFISV